MPDFIQVSTALPHREDAEPLARVLVERRLAACVQVIGPVSSTYWWQGKIETAEEWLCLIKSRASLFDLLESAIREIHPYETPEIVALPIVSGSKDYLMWLGTELEQQQ